MSLALIGNVSARKCRGEELAPIAETFSIRRLEGSRWRLRRTLAMGIECHFDVERIGDELPTNVESSDEVSRSGRFGAKNGSHSVPWIYGKGLGQGLETRMHRRALSTSTVRR